ncbi:MAG: protein translocase subunit SecF [Dehalococcoidia bacterium]|nr:protein translocase subunit SecF [Dehalococcoidia bacterium]
MIDFAGKRWWALGLSIVIMLVFGGALAIFQLKPGIEFSSGSSFTFEFGQDVAAEEIRAALSDEGHPEARVQRTGERTFLIRTNELEGAPSQDQNVVGPTEVAQGEIDEIQSALQERFGPITRQDFATVSGSVSTEIARNATYAVIAASLAILVYISLAFRRLPGSWRYGTCAVVSLLHDALIILGLFAFLGHWRGTEVDTAFITALLTVIGFSVHDTIVVFDRMREVMAHDPYVPFEEAVNASLTETLARSINTSVVVVLTVTAMLLMGGETIRDFLLVLLVGVVAGTYSSIFVASQLLVAWERNDIGRFFRRITGREEEGEGVPETA